MISKPPVIDLVDHFYSKSVKVVMHWYEEALVKLVLSIEDFA